MSPAELPKTKNTILNRNIRYADMDVRRFQSPVLYDYYARLAPLLKKYVRQSVLDVGCGTMPFKKNILTLASSYDTLDIEAQVPGVTFIGDATQMSAVPSSHYETVLCLNVLEHVREPEQAIREMYRALKPGGALILSVPHLNRLHEIPHDYYRFTEYGIKHILTKSGFDIVELLPTAGLIAFLGHQVSTAFIALLWNIPYAQKVVLGINYILFVMPSYWLDLLLNTKRYFPVGYICVAYKK